MHQSTLSMTSGGSVALTSTVNNIKSSSIIAAKIQQANHTSSVETQLRNVKIDLSGKKAPSFMSEYSNALYNKAV